ncbi:hypothetical protein Pcinc_012588 [Petrolisthes cinctipes]|uniref:Uncharacterized protein n=1 Tax=Petrolisthes cinctipes TaxID=88211 RepID=A0AAE1G0E6_PETCI|nr:hypothetical protein Pcinc_012588 [Petrolisthes cinctipes]
MTLCPYVVMFAFLHLHMYCTHTQFNTRSVALSFHPPVSSRYALPSHLLSNHVLSALNPSPPPVTPSTPHPPTHSPSPPISPSVSPTHNPPTTTSPLPCSSSPFLPPTLPTHHSPPSEVYCV